MIGRTSAEESESLVRYSVMAPSRIAALARARLAGLLVLGPPAARPRSHRGLAGSHGRATTRHGAQVSLEQYCNYACVKRGVHAIEQGNRDHDHQQRKITGPPFPRACTKKHTKKNRPSSASNWTGWFPKMPLRTMKACPTTSTSPTNATAFDSGKARRRNQEFHREDRPKEGDDVAR